MAESCRKGAAIEAYFKAHAVDVNSVAGSKAAEAVIWWHAVDGSVADVVPRHGKIVAMIIKDIHRAKKRNCAPCISVEWCTMAQIAIVTGYACSEQKANC